jgi:molybdenum cofactor guanylyltransferase
VAVWAAVVLAGGRARRLGGVDKPALTVGGRRLLDVVLHACDGAAPVVVVGPRRPVDHDVLWRRERPPHGGPVAALAAGLDAVPDGVRLTALLAADLPGLRAATVARLLAAAAPDRPSAADRAVNAAADRAADRTADRAGGAVAAGRHDGVVLVDEGGRWQWLCGVWRTAALRQALAAVGDPRDRSVRSVLGGLTVLPVPARPGEAVDVDTPEDLRALRIRLPE